MLPCPWPHSGRRTGRGPSPGSRGSRRRGRPAPFSLTAQFLAFSCPYKFAALPTSVKHLCPHFPPRSISIIILHRLPHRIICAAYRGNCARQRSEHLLHSPILIDFIACRIESSAQQTSISIPSCAQIRRLLHHTYQQHTFISKYRRLLEFVFCRTLLSVQHPYPFHRALTKASKVSIVVVPDVLVFFCITAPARPSKGFFFFPTTGICWCVYPSPAHALASSLHGR